MRILTPLLCFLLLLITCDVNAQGWRHFVGPSHLPDSTVTALGVAGDSLLIGTEGGLVIRHNGKSTFITKNDGLASNRIYAVTGSDDGQILVVHGGKTTWINSNGDYEVYNKGSSQGEVVYNPSDKNFYLNFSNNKVFKDGEFTSLNIDFRNLTLGPNNFVYAQKFNGTIYSLLEGNVIDTFKVKSNQHITARSISGNDNRVLSMSIYSTLFELNFDSGYIDTCDVQSPLGDSEILVDSRGQIWKSASEWIARGTDVFEAISLSTLNHAFDDRLPMVEFHDSIFLALNTGYAGAPLDVPMDEYTQLRVNDFEFSIGSDGGIGIFETLPSIENGFRRIGPSNIGGYHLLDSAFPWFAGITSNGDILHAGNRFSEHWFRNYPDQPYISSGPYSTSFDHPRNHQAWLINKEEISEHQDKYQDSAYTLPADFKSWQTHGYPGSGEAACLAPFIDVDGDGKYIPQAGDYPQIRGDVATYAISNDSYFPRFYPTIDTPMGIEIHTMVYGYKSPYPVLKNTLFVNLRIVNRGNNDFSSFRWGMFNYFSFGTTVGVGRNFVGCDTNYNLSYVYYALDYDYENDLNPGSFGLVFLNSEMSSHLKVSTPPGFPFFTSAPHTGQQRFWLLDGKEASQGAPLPYNLPNGQPSPFMYPGDPVSGQGISEISENNSGFLRRTVTAGSETVLHPGDTLEMDLAYIFAHNPGSRSVDAINALRAQAANVQSWYDNQTFEPWQTACTPRTVGTEEESSIPSSLTIYPNPTKNEIRISGMEGSFSYRIFNLQGQLMQAGKASSQEAIPLKNVNPGMYLVQIDQEEVLKLLIR